MRILIKNGTVIDTHPSVTVSEVTDVLVDGDRIEAVGRGLPEDGAEVIDATGRLVLPGFVDSHRHTWQAPYRAIVADADIQGYFQTVLGELAPSLTPDGAHAGNLAGARECLDAGVTTLLDWTQATHTPEHTDALVAALRESGIRAVLGYCPQDFAAEPYRVRDTCVRADGLLTMAIAALGPEIAGEERTLQEWRLARDLDLPVTAHLGGSSPEQAHAALMFLHDNGLLERPTTYIHAIHYSDEDFKLIAGTGGSVSVSPVDELTLGIGYPVTGRAAAAGAAVSLSADTVTCGPGDMFSLMRAAFAMERGRGNLAFTTRDVLRMATIGGAETVGLGAVTGSLTPGKQADLILLRTDTPGMSGTRDPIGAIVLNADTSAVETVLVAGRFRKRDGRLL
ncbi:amidohydrolase family protein [Nonomuraea typhae]|uniref:amidohydrolase family protein n=1 Tax=Nonomuraea typhae TaxID=2603600 RepID=UPI0012F8D899|nr:amidohydrolase family protein [Nonomuraea typhae]